MKVAALQHDVVWQDASATIDHVVPLIEAAAAAGARLSILTEMFSTGFTMEPERFAESPDGPSTTFLMERAARHQMWLAASIPIRVEGGRPRNRFTLAGPGGEQFVYDKIHPFTYSGEHEHYEAGSTTITVEVDGVRVTPFVCYDLRFADSFWAAAPSTDLYVVVANWPELRGQHWRSLLVARAIENQAYVIGVNRVGEGGGVVYAGDSMMIDPLGEVLVAGDRSERVLSCDVEAGRVSSNRARYPFLQDRT